MESDDDAVVNEMDAQIARTKFWSVVQHSCWHCVTDAPGVWKGPNGGDYTYEQSLFEKNVRPLLWGVGCTVVTFVTFRLTASRIFQQFRSKYLQQTSTSTSAPLPPPSAVSSNATTSSVVERRKQLQHELMSRALSIPKDLLLSAAIGLSATAFLVDTNQVRQDLERVPGLPGRSLLADTMCPKMIELYKQTPSRVWQRQQDDDDDDTVLKSMQTISRNCIRRQKLESAERQRLGLANDQPVSIPLPGFL